MCDSMNLQKETKYYYDSHAKQSYMWTIMCQPTSGGQPLTSVSQQAPRSYFITTPQGQTYRRNEWRIKRLPSQRNEWEEQTYIPLWWRWIYEWDPKPDLINKQHCGYSYWHPSLQEPRNHCACTAASGAHNTDCIVQHDTVTHGHSLSCM